MASRLIPETEEEWAIVHRNATEQQSDGCTDVPEFYHACCELHDTFYRTGRSWRDGEPVTRREADAALRDCIRGCSRFGFWSPMALWRWVAVRLFGGLRGYGPPSQED